MALFPLFSSKRPAAEATAFAASDATVGGVTLSAAMQDQRDVEESTGDESIRRLPLIGHLPLQGQQRLLVVLLVVAVLLVGVSLTATLRITSSSAGLLNTSGDALMQSQRVAKSVSAALLGSKEGFGELQASADALEGDLRRLHEGDTLHAGGSRLAAVTPMVDATVKNARVVVKMQSVLTQTNDALRTISRQSDSLLQGAQTLTSLLLQQGAGGSDVAAAAQLEMLTQRIGKSANEFLSYQGISPEAVFALGRDLQTFEQLANGLQQGDANLQLSPVRGEARTQVEGMIKAFAGVSALSRQILGNLQSLSSARLAQTAVLHDSVPLLGGLQELQAHYSSQAGVGSVELWVLVAAALLAVLALLGLGRLYVQASRERAVQSERERRRAERQEQEARRSNEANQAAILRLMNELQNVAEGDLTQEATVTEDITGAIADSVNYTVEELRSLVAQVQKTAEQVRRSSGQAQTTAGDLLRSSEQQLIEIRETGRSVLDMAERINSVSAQAQQSSTVARQSLDAAEQGLLAVRNSIDGMNSIRSQIQDTSKRIKRLGESSQEIGEITELISDLTEQTNVLALNAAIQAASAGDAGRGFSVVAEEVQRLAERSAEATKQIAALVRTIQTDTQDAVAAMEKSTQGVVEGARLSDSAGAALSEIDRVSRQLAELIERISHQALTEAQAANQVATSIQHIFAVTEQTGDGTRSTAELVAELARVAEVLRESVSRFKIA
ncbi:MAG: methyl-accepting chemotaxis protein [Betaproteobacteria bacterium]|nr:methyl-accepting chemotaxis protein [Betaproteobacteria bacterium]MBU6510734.1 methyl-accepting chemotaxis protein [Betaproteobacteria bacterium]MDE2151736.1 type IV pili methyl-accepting chemotaxis transducer N-terminal domain-containing protein [Betaproteobacteria bacterium]